MIITFYTPTLKLSGGNIVMVRYAEYLAKNNIDVYVIAPAEKKSEYVKNGVTYRTFKKIPNKHFEHIFFQLIYIFAFYFNTPKCDIIIPVFFPLIIHSIIAKKMHKCSKIISFFQDSKQMFWFGKYIYFLLKIPFVTNSVDKFIAVSTPIANDIQKYVSKDIAVIPNGIEHEYFYPRDTQKENYILFVGSSSKMKGFQYFLAAFNQLQKKYPNLKAKVVSQTVTNENNPNIEYVNIGNDRNKLGELYSKALVFVSQSLSDSFGLPPLEAMACGTAVVLTDTVGAKEYAVNGENSIIVPVKNPACTANAIDELLSNKNLCLKLQENGLVIAQKYNWNDSFKALKKELVSIYVDN
mgnify:FL=1